MDEKQKLFRTVRLILQLGCLTYVAIAVLAAIAWIIGSL